MLSKCSMWIKFSCWIMFGSWQVHPLQLYSKTAVGSSLIFHYFDKLFSSRKSVQKKLRNVQIYRHRKIQADVQNRICMWNLLICWYNHFMCFIVFLRQLDNGSNKRRTETPFSFTFDCVNKTSALQGTNPNLMLGRHACNPLQNSIVNSEGLIQSAYRFKAQWLICANF